MYNLFYKRSTGKPLAGIEKPFKTEVEFEKYLMDTKEIFSDIFILKRQVNAGRNIPDMIGIDKDNNIVIIENKNVEVSGEILPQILRYALWAENSPDSIRAMWLEAKNRPDDIEVDWDNVDIRIIVLAPSIKLSTLRVLKKINYNIELIEVKRFVVGVEECLLLNKLEEIGNEGARVVRGLAEYNKDFYKNSHNDNSVDVFYKLIHEVEVLIKRKKWNLDTKFNKNYVGFKTGFPNVFGIQWMGTKSLGFFFKINRSQFKFLQKVSPYTLNYDERWKQATLRYEKNVSIRKLEKVFETTYKFFVKR